MKLLSNMDKYRHTAIGVCKRKEHKAAPLRAGMQEKRDFKKER